MYGWHLHGWHLRGRGAAVQQLVAKCVEDVATYSDGVHKGGIERSRREGRDRLLP